jgi:hypothetical protein
MLDVSFFGLFMQFLSFPLARSPPFITTKLAPTEQPNHAIDAFSPFKIIGRLPSIQQVGCLGEVSNS